MLGAAAVIGAAVTLANHVFLTEYGPTTGSLLDGALAGLAGGAVALLFAVALAVAALFVHRGSAWTRAAAAAVIVLSLAGAALAGAQAAAARYDSLPRVPDCGAERVAGDGPPRFQDAFDTIAHPGRFGAVNSSTEGCRGLLPDVGFGNAAAHYRTTLRDAGWEITKDDATRLTARSGELEFELAGCEPITVTIGLAGGEGLGSPC